MDTLLLNYEETPGAQLQNLIMKLVKQQVQEQLQHLQKTGHASVTKLEEGTKQEINAPIIICEHKLKKAIQEMTPVLKRRSLPLLIQTRMLMKLYEHKESGITPSLLFSYAGTGKISGYRYISFFKDRNYLTFIGARQNGKYILTDKGRKLLETL
ncbi:MAG TPA: hypothetical protein VJY62_17545 [Bacteroidia bacterium]|nr:hypothetical protein [Bacteroidia bacterium]